MKIIECPRDAMQGIEKFIPTDVKAKYINLLLQVGFDTIDFGSFVSSKAIPQLRDTAKVYDQLDLDNTKSKLLAIVANTRGAEEAVQFEGIHYLGFPFSISETFQQRNTNKSIVEALNTLGEIQELCKKHNKVLVTYISMGFGNPYNDPYDVSIVAQFTDILATLEIEVISLADTIGVSRPEQITYLFKLLKKQFPKVEFGAHLHSNPATAKEKIEAAYHAGCNRFDGALKGWGGCPMAEDELVGNLATETILDYLTSQNAQPEINKEAFAKSLTMADSIFSIH
ncbi:MAG: hydroxymethylglutaryl-CoA lyase [Cyclobacteriaceae bacterium]|nr:hydroxymethylglutaryl-CoA lyase [Cyclobacteriaceae bacterium]